MDISELWNAVTFLWLLKHGLIANHYSFRVWWILVHVLVMSHWESPWPGFSDVNFLGTQDDSTLLLKFSFCFSADWVISVFLTLAFCPELLVCYIERWSLAQTPSSLMVISLEIFLAVEISQDHIVQLHFWTVILLSKWVLGHSPPQRLLCFFCRFSC